MIHVQIDDELTHQGASLDPALLEQAALQTLHHTDADLQSDLTVALAGDEQLQRLNREYLGIDAPTDVLSFPDGEIDPDTQTPYLGDVIISYPRAAAQALAGEHAVEAELQLLVVHGVLHLLGYDHATEAEKARMWQTQAAVLESLGCPISGPAPQRSDE